MCFRNETWVVFLFFNKFMSFSAVGDCTGDQYSYFSVTTDETDFIIASTSAFENFDKNTPKRTLNIEIVNLQCRLKCTSEATLVSKKKIIFVCENSSLTCVLKRHK